MSLEEVNKKWKRNAVYSHIVGSTFRQDGQENIKKLEQAQKLFMVFEDDNAFDPNAVKLYADEAHTRELGYIQRELAKDVRELVKNGIEIEVRVTEVTGNTADKKNAGCNILIIKKS
jgi:hypothetical protein